MQYFGKGIHCLIILEYFGKVYIVSWPEKLMFQGKAQVGAQGIKLHVFFNLEGPKLENLSERTCTFCIPLWSRRQNVLTFSGVVTLSKQHDSLTHHFKYLWVQRGSIYMYKSYNELQAQCMVKWFL